MYLYYQQSTAKDEDGKGESWKSIKDSPTSRQALAEKQVQMVSMLAVSNVSYDADYEQLKYRGDLYFDIDHENVELAIESVKQLVGKLRQLEVYNFSVFATGKKGFHVTVPAGVFCTNTSVGVKWLPYIYGHMAEHHFSVPGLDYAVYSGGKGRLWRQPNVQRLDNQKYKVPIRPEQLEGLDKDGYGELCSLPNYSLLESIEKTEPTFCLALASIFEQSMAAVKAEQEAKEVFRFEPVPELEMLSSVPGCVQKLAKGEDVKDGANFNKAAMNLAGYLKASNRIGTEVEDDLVGLLASHNNYGSASYTNDRDRRIHIKSMIRRAKNDRSMGCNPPFLLALVERCGKCPICDGTLKSSSKDSEYESKREKKQKMGQDGLRANIFEVGLSYVKELGPRSVKPLTTFTLEPVSANKFFHEEAQQFRRESLLCNVKYSIGEGLVKEASVTIEEDSWDSASSFKKQFRGIDNLAITASEDDLADLRHYIMSKYKDIDDSVRTNTIGLDVREVPSKDGVRRVLVYTEPGFTATGNNIKIPLHYASRERSQITGAPKIAQAPTLDPENPDDVRAAKAIFKINEGWICASMVGWMAATAIKPHVMGLFNEFPLMAVTGLPGSGKTTLSAIMADLAGCAFKQTDEPATATSTQAFIERYIAGSTSVPRIIDEANDPAFRSNPKLLETLKGVWNGLEMGKSGYEQGSALATRSVKLTGPVLYISEQPRSDDALRQRSIEMFLSLSIHPTTPTGEELPAEMMTAEMKEVKANFEWISEHEQRDRLRGIGRAIIMKALKTKRSWVKDQLAGYADAVRPVRAHVRQKYSWRVILVGLDLYRMALMDEYGIDVSLEVKEAKDLLLSRLLDKEITDSGSDNCNNDVMQFIAVMAHRAAVLEMKGGNLNSSIIRGVDYLKDEGHLTINLNTIWPTVMSDARRSGTNLKYTSPKQFISAIIHEPYTLSVKEGLLVADTAILKSAGVSTDFFYTEEEWEAKFGGLV